MQRLEPEHIENQTFPLTRKGYDTEKVDAFLQVVAAYYREAIRQAEARARAEPSAAGPFEQLGDQVAAVLSTAARTAEELTTSAEREAQRMKKVAAAEAAEITRAANDQLAAARQARAEAQNEAEALLVEARDEAARLKKDAHTVAARLEERARQRAEGLEQAANAKVAAIIAEANRRQVDLRQTAQQSANHLRLIEAAIRKARDQLTSETLLIRAEELSSGEIEPEDTVLGTGDHASSAENADPATDGPTREMVAEVLEPGPTRNAQAPNRGRR